MTYGHMTEAQLLALKALFNSGHQRVRVNDYVDNIVNVDKFLPEKEN